MRAHRRVYTLTCTRSAGCTVNIRGHAPSFSGISRKAVRLCFRNDYNLRNHGDARACACMYAYRDVCVCVCARCIDKIIFQREHYSRQMYFAQRKKKKKKKIPCIMAAYWSVLKGYRRRRACIEVFTCRVITFNENKWWYRCLGECSACISRITVTAVPGWLFIHGVSWVAHFSPATNRGEFPLERRAFPRDLFASCSPAKSHVRAAETHVDGTSRWRRVSSRGRKTGTTRST